MEDNPHFIESWVERLTGSGGGPEDIHKIGTTDDENALDAEPKIRGKNMNATLNSDAIKILRCLSRSPKRRRRGETLHRSPFARR